MRAASASADARSGPGLSGKFVEREKNCVRVWQHPRGLTCSVTHFRKISQALARARQTVAVRCRVCDQATRERPEPAFPRRHPKRGRSRVSPCKGRVRTSRRKAARIAVSARHPAPPARASQAPSRRLSGRRRQGSILSCRTTRSADILRYPCRLKRRPSIPGSTQGWGSCSFWQSSSSAGHTSPVPRLRNLAVTETLACIRQMPERSGGNAASLSNKRPEPLAPFLAPGPLSSGVRSETEVLEAEDPASRRARAGCLPR
jgi:hypothetical protein